MDKFHNQFQKYTWLTVISTFSLIAINTISCSNSASKSAVSTSTLDEIIQFFNSKGRFARFENTELIFGDTISDEVKKSFPFEEMDEKNQLSNV